jgi:dihydrofolate synthase/folylpolyglutamate synthase
MRGNQGIVIGDVNPPRSLLSHAQQVNQSLSVESQKLALAKIKVRERDFTIIEQTSASTGQALWQLKCTGLGSSSENHWCLNHLLPTHIPRDNVATALMVLNQLGITLTTEKVNRIIEQTKVSGRTEMFYQHCDIMLDVGHNPHAGRYLANQLSQLKIQKGYKKIIAVTAMLADKDITNTLLALNDHIDTWYIAPLNMPRSATVESMKSALNTITNSINCFDNVTQAFKMAEQDAKSTDLVLVFGSFYTVAEIRKLLL